MPGVLAPEVGAGLRLPPPLPAPAGGAGVAASREANCGTAPSGVQFFIPAEKSSVFASMLPFSRFDRISSALTGPTWCPPIAMYHWGVVDISASFFRYST